MRSISAFASYVCALIGFTSSAVGINICAIIAVIRNYKSIIKKKKKKQNKKVLLEKDKLNTIEVLISVSLMNSHISHDEFVSVNNVLREYNEMKNKIKYSETSAVKYTILKHWKPTASVVKNIPRTKLQVLEKLNKIDQCSYQTVLLVPRKN